MAYLSIQNSIAAGAAYYEDRQGTKDFDKVEVALQLLADRHFELSKHTARECS